MNTSQTRGTIYRRKVLSFSLLIIFLLSAPLKDGSAAAAVGQPESMAQAAGPTIRDITDNLGEYPGGQVPRYQKLEITFQVDTQSANLQMPYSAAPPAGVTPGEGISVDALFSKDNWQTVYTQPAFYYQDFLDEVKSGQEWFYPSGSFAWKVRFSPNETGTWQYKIRAQDASGVFETQARTFTAAASTKKGFVRVSQNDSRYFAYGDGTYFPSLGYNMSFDDIAWANPVLGNVENFLKMSENGIQLARIWLSQWGIYGPSWNPWQSIDPSQHGQYIPYSGMTFDQAYGSSEVSMEINADYNACMFIGFMQARPAVKPNTNYRVRVRYRTVGINGPAEAGKPYGFVAKTGGWLWGNGNYCQDPGTGTVVTPYQPQATSDWQILQGSLNSGSNDFLPYFYLALENVSSGRAYVDTVWIEEDLGGGQYGPNIVSKPWMAHHLYMEQRNSYALDKVVELAEQYGVYLRPVIHEKNEWIFNRIDFDGGAVADDPRCWDADNTNNPAACPGNQWFYGSWRNMTKVRWLQQAWWRYLQARWGYSPSVHSWELLNEGDPWNNAHYTLADEFARYMHQFAPNDHMVSTSFWHSFPRDEFWANPEYQAVDFADVHKYIPQNDALFADTAQASNAVSMELGAKQSGGAKKPVIRGETGLTVSESEPPTEQLNADTKGTWLHNFIWGGINPGGLIESYWYQDYHIYRKINGTYQFDHRPHYGNYYQFIKDIPLANGSYVDAAAAASEPNLRAWGQKDLANGRAHLWIQNKHNTWQLAAGGQTAPALSGTVTLAGFNPGAAYSIQWWDTYQADPARQVIRTDTLAASSDGALVFTVQNLTTDTAVRIFPSSASPTAAAPTATRLPATATRLPATATRLPATATSAPALPSATSPAATATQPAAEVVNPTSIAGMAAGANVLLDFNNIPDPVDGQPLPAGYAGLTWNALVQGTPWAGIGTWNFYIANGSSEGSITFPAPVILKSIVVSSQNNTVYTLSSTGNPSVSMETSGGAPQTLVTGWTNPAASVLVRASTADQAIDDLRFTIAGNAANPTATQPAATATQPLTTATQIAATATQLPATATKIAPTATRPPATATQPAPTATRASEKPPRPPKKPTTTPPATATRIPATATQPPATATRLPATATRLPATATTAPVSPSLTPTRVPSTATQPAGEIVNPASIASLDSGASVLLDFNNIANPSDGQALPSGYAGSTWSSLVQGSPWGGVPTWNFYIANGGSQGTIQFPRPVILKSIVVGSQNSTVYALSSAGNPDVSITTSGNLSQTLVTGWTNPVTSVVVRASTADQAIDDLRFTVSGSPVSPSATPGPGTPTATRSPATATRPPSTPTRTPTAGPAQPTPTTLPGGETGAWPMVAANPERSSWTSAEVRGPLNVQWYRPIEAYIPQHVQVITSNGLLYISTAKGLYALRADNGAIAWRYDTEMPLGHSPSVDKSTNTIYVGGFDRKLHALNALDGRFLWSYDGAAAGYDTNPLLIEGKVIVGNRDGNLYAVGVQGSAQQGQLIWKFQTGGPVRFSPAYKNGVIYFASNDNIAYAVRASDGALIWKSGKMEGDGFQSYWPVVYTDPTTRQDYVIFAAASGYRAFMDPGSDSASGGWSDLFNGGATMGPQVAVNEPWAQGKTVVDYSRVAQHYESKPYRRHYFIYKAQAGANQTAVEYTTDFDGDGNPEYAPVDPFLSNSGNPYPPVVGSDGMLYMGNHYWFDGQSLLMGWRMGTPYFTLTQLQGAGDEPNAHSSGGKYLYRSICCDRAGDWTSTNPADRGIFWSYNLEGLAPGYDEQWWFYDPNILSRLTGNYGTVNGVYHSHGDQNPLIPYQGRVFIHRSNAIIAFGPGTQLGKLPTLTANPVSTPGSAPSATSLAARLENEVQKILDAGHLRPGYYNAGQFNQALPWMADYFSNPGDTLYTLSMAYPYMSSATQTQLKSYLKEEFSLYFNPGMVAKVGWDAGAAREWMPLPPEVAGSMAGSANSQAVDYNAWGWTYPQYNFYAMWKYISLVAPEDTQIAYSLAKSKLKVPATGSEFYRDRPWIVNGYIAGYTGFLELQKAAGKTATDASLFNSVTNELERMKQLRLSTFSTNTSFQTFDQYTKRTMNISRNFVMLVPELGDFLNRNMLAKATEAINEYQKVGPYWFVSRYSASVGESTTQNLYDYPALFQAKAYILKQNRGELAKYLDVPAFARGDLFYMQNIIAAIQAPE